jgi:hypothetical protein
MSPSLGFTVLGKSQNDLNHVEQTLFLNSRMLFRNKYFASHGEGGSTAFLFSFCQSHERTD